VDIGLQTHQRAGVFADAIVHQEHVEGIHHLIPRPATLERGIGGVLVKGHAAVLDLELEAVRVLLDLIRQDLRVAPVAQDALVDPGMM
jgi:hypothetical protein